VPEILEIEAYRALAERVVGRRIESVDAPDAWYLKGGIDANALTAAVRGHVVERTRRTGKLLLLDLHGAPTMGLRFGMTGRLIVDGVAGIAELEYGSNRDDPAWARFRLGFDDGGSLVMIDARRLGGVILDPDEDRLGFDALTLSNVQLVHVLRSGGAAPLKARLMDQSRVAGLGNLLTDEALWRAGLDPAREARGLSDGEIARLRTTVVDTLVQLGTRGGSHTGDLQIARMRGGLCPRDGTPLERRTIAGRTTYSCPQHQR
jgi:formamidopyrimidine-DNA glycosylase